MALAVLIFSEGFDFSDNKLCVTTNMQNLTKTAAYSILPSFELGKNLAPYPCTNISGLCIRVFLHTKGNPF
jgi:hypothetical protein